MYYSSSCHSKSVFGGIYTYVHMSQESNEEREIKDEGVRKCLRHLWLHTYTYIYIYIWQSQRAPGT